MVSQGQAIHFHLWVTNASIPNGYRVCLSNFIFRHPGISLQIFLDSYLTRFTCAQCAFISNFLQIKTYKETDDEALRKDLAKVVFDEFIMKELLACSYVSFSQFISVFIYLTPRCVLFKIDKNLLTVTTRSLIYDTVLYNQCKPAANQLSPTTANVKCYAQLRTTWLPLARV